jgi:hypothetical protein
LVLSDLDVYTTSDDEGKVPFYETPMANVKRLELNISYKTVAKIFLPFILLKLLVLMNGVGT